MSFLEKGAIAVVKRLPSDCEIVKDLFEIGVRLESKFEILFKGHDLVIKVDQTKIALDKTFCDNILVDYAVAS